MKPLYHTTCNRATPSAPKTSFQLSQTKQYVRPHLYFFILCSKADFTSSVLLYWGSSSHAGNRHVNSHFRIPKANRWSYHYKYRIIVVEWKVAKKAWNPLPKRVSLLRKWPQIPWPLCFLKSIKKLRYQEKKSLIRQHYFCRLFCQEPTNSSITSWNHG